ncbi:hypothetical protein [Rhizosphaericola mali]|uniref:Polysaccharide pyruvyl transferase family protein n=1 Tax=Rhizosphaericola mali TaxID=2545455 RepID=A0A5P2G4L0_9BACT|nr:hypothetical protein [Rhizosphaericola mali]QES90764.1 hypothetical protein E0W69_019595 [Rhizosphaericola mali]
MRKKVYLICIAGYPNYGDELILNSWLHWLHDNFHGKIDIVIDSIHKESLYFMIDNYDDRNYEIVNSISKIINDKYKVDYVPNKLSRVKRFLFRDKKIVGTLSVPRVIPLRNFLGDINKNIITDDALYHYSDYNIIHLLGGVL